MPIRIPAGYIMGWREQWGTPPAGFTYVNVDNPEGGIEMVTEPDNAPAEEADAEADEAEAEGDGGDEAGDGEGDADSGDGGDAEGA